MTIKELKEKLQELPDDLEIFCDYEDSATHDLKSISDIKKIEGECYPYYRKGGVAVISLDY